MDATLDLGERISGLWRASGARRQMGDPAQQRTEPHYHLLRKFKGETDLLLILNTKRCYYNCSFCDLPTKSSQSFVTADDTMRQIVTGLSIYRESLDVIDRLTISNEGSVFDADTLDSTVLQQLADAVNVLPGIRRLVLETRPEFVTAEMVDEILARAPRSVLDVLVGFETQDDHLRNVVLGKRQSRESLINLMDMLSVRNRTALTSYVLVKPGFDQDDADGIDEAKATISYLAREANLRNIGLSIRLNPMYIPSETRWGKKATTRHYLPPRLSDVLDVAQWAERRGIQTYIGLSTEGIAGPASSYRCRDDFSKDLLKKVIAFNAQPAQLDREEFSGA